MLLAMFFDEVITNQPIETAPHQQQQSISSSCRQQIIILKNNLKTILPKRPRQPNRYMFQLIKNNIPPPTVNTNEKLPRLGHLQLTDRYCTAPSRTPAADSKISNTINSTKNTPDKVFVNCHNIILIIYNGQDSKQHPQTTSKHHKRGMYS